MSSIGKTLAKALSENKHIFGPTVTAAASEPTPAPVVRPAQSQPAVMPDSTALDARRRRRRGGARSRTVLTAAGGGDEPLGG